MVGAARAGFTLVEAIVALTISSAIVIMVSTVFLVQNQYYAIQVSRSAVQDNARMMTEVVGSELRSVASGGVIVALSDSLVVRSPVVLAAICAWPGANRVTVQYVGGEAEIDADEISGFAVQDTVSHQWSYYDVPSWSTIDQNGGSPAAECAANGADTAGVAQEFQRLRRLNVYHGTLPAVGQILTLYRRVVYTIRPSQMNPNELGLYRATWGESPVEFATGVDSTAQFQYRTGGSTYANSVTGGSVANIDAIRIVAQARMSPQTGGVDDITYGWSVNVVLRNGG